MVSGAETLSGAAADAAATVTVEDQLDNRAFRTGVFDALRALRLTARHADPRRQLRFRPERGVPNQLAGALETAAALHAAPPCSASRRDTFAMTRRAGAPGWLMPALPCTAASEPLANSGTGEEYVTVAR